jgi:hypothetical protein
VRGFFLGALLFAGAPLFSQSELSGIQLNESPAEVRKILGEPVLVADINSEFRSWQYRVGDIDHDEYSHALIFRRSTNSLVSISRTFEAPIQVEKLFPEAATTYHRYPETGNAEMTVRLRRLPQDRLLLAFGSAKPGDPAIQLVLIHRSVVPVFYPWLANQIK